MLETTKRWLLRLLWLTLMITATSTVWFGSYVASNLAFNPPLEFSLKQGSSLRSATRQMQAAGVFDSARPFELMARLLGEAEHVQAGNYELDTPLTPIALLKKITSGDYTQDQITVVEGWTFAQLRAVLDSHPAMKHDTRGLTESEIVSHLGIPKTSPEGWFFPDTYFFAAGTSDIALLQRAYRLMRSQLDALWNARASGLPLENAYQALILASIVEKETGQPGERPMIAAVFINRLRLGIKLQTDPTVIYGLGSAFDGNLRKQDLLADGPYNTYTRAGLPPTPIAAPGLDALAATLHPAPGNALYFVARGDGTSHFSATLADHERAVTKYQRRPRR